MALSIEQLPTQQAWFVYRASCDSCGCVGLTSTHSKLKSDVYARQLATGRAEGQGWAERMRGHILQMICPDCLEKEAERAAENQRMDVAPLSRLPEKKAEGVGPYRI